MFFNKDLELQMDGVNYSGKEYQNLCRLMVGGLSNEEDIKDRVRRLQETFNNFKHFPNGVNDIRRAYKGESMGKILTTTEDEKKSIDENFSSKLYDEYYKGNQTLNLEKFKDKLKEKFSLIREAIRLNFLSDDDIEKEISDINSTLEMYGSFYTHFSHDEYIAPDSEEAKRKVKESYLCQIFVHISAKVSKNYLDLVEDCYLEIPKRSNFTKAIETFINFAAYMLRNIKDLLERGATSSIDAVKSIL